MPGPHRILHVGWGFTPWRTGGLIAYAEDVMRAQAAAGHEVAYFCAGRHLPWVRRPVLHRRRRGAVRISEALNVPVPHAGDRGTRHPERELDEPATERLFRRVLARERPEVVHVHELAGLPSSLLDVARAAGAPVVFTLQDYLPLCPTVKLFDHRHERCRRARPGRDCAVCCRDAPEGTAELVAHTAGTELARVRRRLPPAVVAVARPLSAQVVDRAVAVPAPAAPSAAAHGPDGATGRVVAPVPPARYDRRRAVNVERLGRVDLLLAMSDRVAEVYAAHGVAGERLRTLHLTLAHIDRLRPRRLEAPPRPVTFAAVNVGSVQKGSTVLLDALARLDAAGLADRYRLAAFGIADPRIRAALRRFPSVTVHPGYGRDELDAVLDAIDVGVIPSVWDEAYAYVGVEFLAKAIPVLGMPVGGIVDYTRPGETGWLAARPDGAALAEALADVIRRPEQVLALHRRIRERRSELVKPFARHLGELEAAYGEVIAAARRRGAAR